MTVAADVEVRDIGEETEAWDAFVRRHPAGSPCHLGAWRRAVEAAFGHRPYYLVAEGDAGIEGVLPLFLCRALMGGRALVSVPYGVYGGILAMRPRAAAALLGAAGALARRLGARYVELRHRREQALDLPTKSLYVTFARPISASDADNLAAIPRKQRRMTRQGVRHGLRAVLGIEHLEAFWEIYAGSVQTLGSPVFPRRLLAHLAAEFGDEAELLTVWRENRMVAGVLSFLYGDQILPYYGGAVRDAFRWAVNDFMYWELMCHAARRGCRVFDFGRSREGTGSYQFKRHWGFEPVPLPYQYVLVDGAPMPDVSPGNPRMRLAVATWKRLPGGVARRLGPLVTRYLP
jgi:FemAB-related protein (PEP-CTERM system-associated)